MQRFAWVFAAFLILALQLPASPCIAGGTLASYEALGVTGCTVGPQTVNDFSFSSSTTGSATAVPDTSIFVTPAFGTNLYGLIFSTTGDFAVTTGSVTYLLGFTWDSLPIRGMDDVLDPGNPSVSTDGCVGAAFTPTCAGTPVSVTVNPTQLTDSTFFADTAILGIANTITMSATSSFTTLENDVFVTPEPGSLLLAGLGLSMLAYFESRLRSASSVVRKTDGTPGGSIASAL